MFGISVVLVHFVLIFPAVDPVIVQVGIFKVTWYALSYVVGLMLCAKYVEYIVQKFNFSISSSDNQKNHWMDSFVTYIIVGVIVGGRLGFCVVYDPTYYFSHPIDILKTYEGGMSFHGGFLGVFAAVYFFAKRYKVEFWMLMDLCAISAPLAIGLVRIANFINAELYGRVTNVPWAVLFPNDIQPRHPSQLYESFSEGILLGIIMYFLGVKQKKILTVRYCSGLFAVGYALARIICELFREPNTQFGLFNLLGIELGVTTGQLLSLPILGCGIILFTIKNEKKWCMFR